MAGVSTAAPEVAEDHGLRREVGIIGLIWASEGSIIGSGWLFGALFAAKAAGPAAVLSWIIATIAVIVIAMVLSELGAMYPVVGGTGRFPHYAYVSAAGASFGWFSWLQAAAAAPIEVLALMSYGSVHLPWLIQQTGAGNGQLTAAGYGMTHSSSPSSAGCYASSARSTTRSPYYSIARRAADLAIENARRRVSKELGGRTFAHHPHLQWTVAEALLKLEAISAQLERVTSDWSSGADHGELWVSKLFAAKYNAVEGAKEVVDLALRATGGAAFFKNNELERLYRDVRSGAFHPPGAYLVHDVIAKTALGVTADNG